jgi:regulator of nucleoside diphosphate kinase
MGLRNGWLSAIINTATFIQSRFFRSTHSKIFSSIENNSERCSRQRSEPVITERARRHETKIEDQGKGEKMPVDNRIYISEFDMKRLKGLIKFAEERWDKKVAKYLEELDEELDRAEIVRPEEIPTDVVTMNSTFRLLDLDSGEEPVYTLVFPAKADSSSGKISVLAPIGTAMLGCRVGDTVEWEVPAGLKKLKVKEIVYQPEAAGDYQC